MTETAVPIPHRPTATVEVVVPVYNEAHDLGPNVRRLRRYLDESFPFDSVVTIADNASTDGTWEIARRLAAEVPGVRALHLDAKGRGRALRAAWATSPADVVAYMDVDLSTDLDALLPLVAPLVSGHSNVAIGSRLAPGAHVVRGPKREVISRAYNAILRLVLRNRFSDAQCGFKALRAEDARALLPAVADNEWFFDTELLVMAERNGLRIHEVPVDWSDEPDSRVDIVRTALADLKGVWRLRRPPSQLALSGLSARPGGRRAPLSYAQQEGSVDIDDNHDKDRLVVDDEASILDSVATVLRYEGYDVDVAATGRGALQKAQEGSYDLVVMDVMLPDLDGLEVTRRIRADGLDVPVLFLTAKSDVEDRIAGLTVGGDDYVGKPFSLMEIVARAKAILRRRAVAEHDRGLRFADVVMDEESHEVWRAGTPVPLTATEFNLLRIFLLNPRRVLSKDQIIDHVWHYDFGGNQNIVETYVRYLRRKLDALGPPLIHTIRLVGYVLREGE